MWALAVVLCYTVCGFLLLPPIVRAMVVKQLSKHLERPVSIEKVGLNPYTLAATIRGLVIKDKDGAPLVSWEELRVNFQLVSLFSHAWVFREVSVSKPFVSVRVNKDYSLNFSDIVAKFSPASPPASPELGKHLSWRINRLRLIGAKTSFIDLTPRIPFQRAIERMEMTLLDFGTDSDHKNLFALSGISDVGEQFSWKGSFYLTPLRSEGEFWIDGFALTTYAPLYQDLFRFEIKDGVVNFHSTYRYEGSATNYLLTATNTVFELKSLELVEKENGQAAVKVSNALVTDASVDVMARQAEAGTITVTGGRFVLRRNRDTSVNAVELLKPADSAPAAPGGILLLLRAMTNLVAMLLNTTNVANGTIRDLNLTNCALHLDDLANSQPVRLDLEGIAAVGKNISNRAGTNTTANFSLRWETNGSVRADIKAALSPASAEVKLTLDKLNLLPLAPYLEPYLNIFVLGSKLNLAGTMLLRSSKEALPEIRFHGDAGLDEFSTAGGNAADGLLQWNSLRLTGIEANLNPPVVSVTNAIFEDVFARLIIETNRTLNLLSALRWDGSNAAAAPKSTNLVVSVRPKMSVASIVISNANLHFIDRSLQPNVNLILQQLSGSLSGLSSEDTGRADIHLQGTVNKTAQAEIAGKINPWNSKQPMDLRVSLLEMDLLPGDPYSGKYLGYRLMKGKLSAQLTYQVTEGKLKSENRLTLDQLTLGQKVESADATKLPVRLAIALLKDRDGKIALEIPVRGSLEDPQFNLGQAAYRAIETVLTRIVTSPFSAFLALFGSKSEELAFQEFQPGSTNLLPATITKLDVLARGLYARPELVLEIQGSTDPLTDLEALRRAELGKKLLVQQWNAAANLFPAASNAAGIEAPPVRSSRKAYSSEKGASALRSPVANSSPIPVRPRVTGNFPVQSPSRILAGDKSATAMVLVPLPIAPDPDSDRELLEKVAIAPDALPTLASERARNVKSYLVRAGKVEAQRITETDQVSSKGSRVYVRLQ